MASLSAAAAGGERYPAEADGDEEGAKTALREAAVTAEAEAEEGDGEGEALLDDAMRGDAELEEGGREGGGEETTAPAETDAAAVGEAARDRPEEEGGRRPMPLMAELEGEEAGMGGSGRPDGPRTRAGEVGGGDGAEDDKGGAAAAEGTGLEDLARVKPGGGGMPVGGGGTAGKLSKSTSETAGGREAVRGGSGTSRKSRC